MDNSKSSSKSGLVSSRPASAPKSRRVYSADFKHDALKLAEDLGGVKAAEKLGIDRSLLSSWKKTKLVDGDQAFRGNGVMTTEATELVRLRRENAQLKLEREILKKATEFFMKEQA